MLPEFSIPSFESYISVTEADAILNNRRLASELLEWGNTQEHEKTVMLVKALELIESLHFQGAKEVLDQHLSFPRRGIGTPESVKIAQAELALQLLNESDTTDVRTQLQQQGVKSYSIGNLSETFSEKTRKPKALQNETVERLLRPYLSGGFETC